MIWSRIKIRGFHPSPRAGSCGVLCGYKWYIAGGGSRKKRHAETLIFDVLNFEWSVVAAPPSSCITSNKGFTLVLVQQKEKVFLVAFGGCKKEPSNQVEVMIMEKNEQSMDRRSMLDKVPCPSPFENRLCSTKLAAHIGSEDRTCPLDSVARHNLTSVLEHHGSSRRSISESCLVDSNPVSGNVSLRKQFHNEEEYNAALKIYRNIEGEKYKGAEDVSVSKSSSIQATDHKRRSQDTGVQTDVSGSVNNKEEMPTKFDNELSRGQQKQLNGHLSDKEKTLIPETDGNSVGLHLYETKLAALMRSNGILEGQLAAALASKEAADTNLSSVAKSKQEMEKNLAETVKEMELLKEKLVSLEVAQEESNNLSNIVHSDNVRLEHDVAFLNAVLDDTQKELHSTRGVLAGERARAFQLQVEVFHLKQRLQSMENRSSTPRKPFHIIGNFKEEKLAKSVDEKKDKRIEIEAYRAETRRHHRSVRRSLNEVRRQRVSQHCRELPWRRSFGQKNEEGIAQKVLQWRASVYDQGLRAVPLPSNSFQEQDIVRNKTVKANMQQRIEPWITRELLAILHDPDPSVIVHLASSLFMLSLEDKFKASPVCPAGEDMFVQQLRPFLQDRTDRFWHELRKVWEHLWSTRTEIMRLIEGRQVGEVLKIWSKGDSLGRKIWTALSTSIWWRTWRGWNDTIFKGKCHHVDRAVVQVKALLVMVSSLCWYWLLHLSLMNGNCL
ncbi:Galactose oxidase/kelch repeat superfamily protein [Thalictrum thalictroides]|uniref:Galactose oxidase/kelch repeat superfamily protein n=1 Tax=Thalictrum thalictroides TaxID=46969 RepID=A0A7J6UYV3_THATH|nr:Galactose oxidase/kelch repeat superfamily protein [Thalictrum thalictroides]